MKKLIYYIPALILFAVSCEKEENSPSQIENEPVSEVKMITEVVSGGREESTKATISNTDASFAWTAGDNVAVHVSNGKYVYTSDEGASGATLEASPAKASFTVVYPDGYSRDAFALYPSTIVDKDATNYGQSGQPLNVTFPSSYTLAQVSGETSPCPMISANTAGNGWNFYQLCGLLRLTVNDIPSTAKRLEIDFNGKKVCGAFSITSPVTPGSSVIATADDTANDCITITKDGTDVALGATNLVVNIPLPVGTYTTITITAYDALTDGNVVLTIDRLPFAYTSSNEYGTKRTASFPSSKKAFRGYEVSTGILERTAGDPATYSLTSGAMILTEDPVTGKEYYTLPAGCNPFEPAVYYGNNASRGKYYNSWTTLKDELGADGNNINATSDKLPDGWRFPTGSASVSTDWGKILSGAPKSPITVNGATVTKNAYALVAVTLESGNSYSVEANTYKGMFLLRDGTTIPTGYLSVLGGKSYNDNVLTETKFNDLIKLGCLFVSSSGRCKNNEWGVPEDGYYWTSTGIKNTDAERVQFFDGLGSLFGPYSKSHEYVVKLVKPL